MVAYNFDRQFWPLIRRHEKTGTIRSDRARHARIGEPMQIYGGKNKLLNRDPVCISHTPLIVRFDPNSTEIIGEVQIGGRLLDDHQIEALAICDGFGVSYPEGTARRRMGDFLQSQYGMNDFVAVWLRWLAS